MPADQTRLPHSSATLAGSAPSLSSLEQLILSAIVSGLTAVWLNLWVQWWLGAWFPNLGLPPLWPAGLALAGLASAVLTSLALSPGLQPPSRLRVALAVTGGLSVLGLTAWALGPPRFFQALVSGPNLGSLIAPGALPLLAAVFIWWQGEQLGRSPVGHRAVQSAFYTGVVALAPVLVLNSLAAALSSVQILGSLLLFFTLGLGGLALASLRQQRSSAGLVARALSRQWLALSAAVIGLVLGAGLLAAHWIAPRALEQLSALLGALAQSLLYGLGWLLGPLVVWLSAWLGSALPGLSAFFERFLTSLEIAVERLQSLVAMLMQLATGGHAGGLSSLRRLTDFLASPAFQAGARWSGLFAILLVAAIAFWLAARRLWGQRSAGQDELRESVLSGRLLLAQLQQLLNRRPRRQPARAPDYLALSGGPDDARLIIRRAYQAMLEWARSLRLPRAAGQTPRAYALMLASALPESHDAIDLLTQAYVLARYAAETPSLEQARRAEDALVRLKALHL